VTEPQHPAQNPNSIGPSAADQNGNDRCEVCDSDRLYWRNCKLVCGNCRSIVKSCADL